jgi:hypothetical protein
MLLPSDPNPQGICDRPLGQGLPPNQIDEVIASNAIARKSWSVTINVDRIG